MTIIRHESATVRVENSQWPSKVGEEPRSDRFFFEEPAGVVRPSSIPNRYQILDEVGTGGTGVVYKVRCLETGEIVALKVLKPGIASDQEQQDNLRKEVCLARKVTHKNVCRIHEFSRSNGMACISMEFVEGENLLSKLRRDGRLSVRKSFEIARQICAGLREAHSQGIVHRDLKPANIMLDQKGVVKIMDFGIARLSQGNGLMTGTMAGTPAYMAPEQVELKPIGPRTDIYSVGILMYEMVTGSQAFDGDTPIAIALKQIRESPKRPKELVPDLPASTEALIMKCLHKDPARRFQSVGELDAALAAYEKKETDVPAAFTFKMQVPQLTTNRVIRQVVEKAHAFAVEILRGTVEASRFMGQSFARFKARVYASDPRAAKLTRIGLIFGTLGIVLLGTVVAFGLESTKHPLASLSQNPGALDSKSSRSVSSAEPGQFGTTNQIELAPSSDNISRDVISENSVSAQILPPQIASAASAKSLAGHTTLEQDKAQYAQKHSLTTPSVIRNASGIAAVGKVDETKIDVPASATEFLLADPSADAAGQQKENETKTGVSMHYLEIGPFKNQTWSQAAVDQLAGFGFHAVSVHKGRLWMQSDRVRLGPYAKQTELDAAQSELASHGFTAHPAK
jgi:serine/threonine protein kinase